MSQENVEIFKRAAELWNRDGLAGAREVWESYKGEAFERLDIRYDDFRDLGESILALGEIKIFGRTSQLELTSEIVQLVTFRGGKIAGSRDFMSHAEGLKTAGLRE